MTFRTWLLAALCIAVPLLPVRGQEASVRSGEHADFTRLVFPARAGIDWTVIRDGGDLLTLAFDDPSLVFDTTEVFDRIPRTRLSRLDARGPRLTLNLACDCGVAVWQIPSDHIVIDISGPETPLGISPPRPRPRGPALPLRLAPLQTFSLSGRPQAAAPPQQPAPPPLPDPTTERAAQISIREVSRFPLVTPDTAPEPAEIARLTCPEERIAADFLRQDPAVALDRLPALRAGLFDEAGAPIPSAHRALAEGYLAAGLGVEARQILRTGPDPADPVLLQIAEALDGMPDLSAATSRLEMTCGPATTVLALLSGVTPAAWANADETTLASFVDTLPQAARADLLPRLRPALRRLGRNHVLDLDPPPRDVPAPPLPVAAGTDAAAVTAVIAALEGEATTDRTDILTNALALRASVPDGPLRDDLDRALALDLVRTGHYSEAVRVIGDKAALAEDALDIALRELPPEEAIVVAMRLRPALPSGGAGARRAGEALQAFGLTPLLRSFGAPEPASDIAIVQGTQNDAGDRAWIERRFGDLDPASTRGQLARIRTLRNDAPAARDDFERADTAAEESARLSEVVLSLLGPTD